MRVAFAGSGSAGETPEVRIEAPCLGGAATEEIFPAATPFATEKGLRLFRAGSLLIGHATEPFVPAELAARTEALYRRIFEVCAGRHLFRVWNYLPRINEETAGLEHYRAFCQGRSHAFERALGNGFQPRLPAASAVGSEGNVVTALFVAGEARPAHFENPEQVPAYQYPPEHGPRPPSFARATIARADGREYVFISGTAAIKGHQTIAPDALAPQLDCTLGNLCLIGRTAGLGANLQAPGAQRHFKVYLRHPADLEATRSHLDRHLLHPGDRVTYLHGAICRAALAVEIEATLVRPA